AVVDTNSRAANEPFCWRPVVAETADEATLTPRLLDRHHVAEILSGVAVINRPEPRGNDRLGLDALEVAVVERRHDPPIGERGRQREIHRRMQLHREVAADAGEVELVR